MLTPLPPPDAHTHTHTQAIGKDPPKPSGMIDTLPLLKRTFGKGRAGNLKMATLGHFFGLGAERHRALEDCRMTIEVLKNCALVIYLEEHFDFMNFGMPIIAAGDAKAAGAGEAKADAAAAESKAPTEASSQKSPGPTGSDASKPKRGRPRKSSGDKLSPEYQAMATRVQDLKTRLNDAMKNKDKVWIKYNRGSNPGLQRPIAPIGWSGYLLKALCLQTGIEKKWRVDRIMDLTTAEWGWADAKASSDAEVPGAVAPPGEASGQAAGPVPESAAGAMDCAGGAAEEKGKPQLSVGDKA